MKKLLPALGLLLLIATASMAPRPSLAPTKPAVDDVALGQQQVEKLWADFAAADLAALDKFIAPGFQSLHKDGARDWAQERKLVADLKLTPYALSDFKVTHNGDVLVVTYQCKVGETITAARLAKEETPRLDVFQLTGGKWLLLSHVNVRDVTPTTNANPMLIAKFTE